MALLSTYPDTALHQLRGCAFPAAHLLVETDRLGRIRDAAGMPCGLVHGGPDALIGRTLGDFANSTQDRLQLEEALARTAQGHVGSYWRVHLRSMEGVGLSFLIGGRTLDETASTLYLSVMLLSTPSPPLPEQVLTDPADLPLCPSTRQIQAHGDGPDAPGGPGSGVRARNLIVEFEPGDLTDSDAARALGLSVRRFVDSSSDSYSIQALGEGASRLAETSVRFISGFRAVLETRHVDLVFQPVIDLNRSCTHHLEALSRVPGVPTISEWVRSAEESNLIGEFDLLVADKVLALLAEAQRTGSAPSVAVNLSARSLASSAFLERFLDLSDRHAGLAGNLMIEITETAAITDFEAVFQAVEELRRRGHGVCLDDLGSGTTSFETLRRLPVDYFKLDGAIVRNALHDSRERTILKALAEVGAAFGTCLIAEQIETPEQADLMRTLGCRLGQGYLFGRPSPDLNRFYPLSPK